MGIGEFRNKGTHSAALVGMRRSPDVSPRRLSDISPQLRQLKYLVVDESIKEDLKSSRSVEDINSASIGLTSIEERILRITGYYGYQPWSAIYNREERPRENAAPVDVQPPLAGETGGHCLLRCCLQISAAQARKALWGVAMVLCVCSSWTGSTQLAKLTFQQFDAPFTLTWFATNWNFLFFPLYYTGHLYKSTERQTPKQRYRECCRFFGDDGLTAKVFFTKVAPFGLLWTLTNYLYLQALRRINTTDVSALFCCNKAFVFLLSWIVLRDRFMGVRIVAAILAIAGIVMMTYADGFHSHSVIGIALVVSSASMSALYKVLFKLILGSAKFGEAALFLTILGGANFVFISFIPVILYFTKVEYFDSLEELPWGCLCGVAVLLLTFNMLVNFGIAITYPTLISFGIVLSVPVNAVVDHYTSEISFNSVRVIAVLIICLGFLLLLLPEEWDQCVIQLLARLRTRKKEEPAEGGAEAGPGLGWSRRGRTSMSTFAH
ncbi:solute carrier family 35 member F3 isoform X2 [Lepisosteus oculatus]|uniref:solute carrier family 35 member F3 isoform X2 n=1 Tax=Lepisosteus oculatus TaxID=7918 RepID=UPI0003EACA7C|nr:PREDICTED: putative thiamine transporter SLC35F3 isoform X2 [Lepisosteus oculatus]